MRLIALDIETSNGRGSGALEPRDPGSQIALIQIREEGGEIELLRPTEQTIDRIRDLISDGARFIIHNASFELDWFREKYGIEFSDVWCTMTASQILNAGKNIPDEASQHSARMAGRNLDYLGEWEMLVSEDEDYLEDKKASRFLHNLQSVVYRYANRAVIQKDQGNSDWARELTPEQKRYAADDVRYLHEVYHSQVHFIEKHGLDRVAALEMAILVPVSRMKHVGILLDRDAWYNSSQEYGTKAHELEERLNAEFGRALAEKEGELSLFGDYVPRAFKVSSPSQLQKFFDLEKANEATLRTVSHPLIPDLLRYKEYAKIASTYGEKFLSFIREDTGRIPTNLIQAETATGRFSSRSPNLQNIPADMLKSFLRVAPGKLLVICDYSSVESRILAYASGDSSLIESVNSSDVHWETAKKIFHLPENASRDETFTVGGKQFRGDELRSRAKSVGFGIPYGISPTGLVNGGTTDSEDEAKELIDSYYRQYRDVDKFLKHAIIEAQMKGFTQNPFGRIRWYQMPKTDDPEVLKKAKNSAARQGQNHKIQSGSADVTKQAIADVYDYLLKSGRGDIILTIHDSLILEINHDGTEGETIETVLRLMEEAGPKIIPGIVTPVDADVGHKETRICALTKLPFSVFTHYYKSGKVYETPDIYEPRVAKIVAGADDMLQTLKDHVLSQTQEWRKNNKDLVEAVQELY